MDDSLRAGPQAWSLELPAPLSEGGAGAPSADSPREQLWPRHQGWSGYCSRLGSQVHRTGTKERPRTTLDPAAAGGLRVPLRAQGPRSTGVLPGTLSSIPQAAGSVHLYGSCARTLTPCALGSGKAWELLLTSCAQAAGPREGNCTGPRPKSSSRVRVRLTKTTTKTAHRGTQLPRE